MGGKLLGSEGTDWRNDGAITQDDPVVCEDSEKEVDNFGEVLWQTVEHFFPRFNEWLRQIPDPRNPRLIIYKLETLMWAGMLMFATARRARKQIGYEMRTEEFVRNLVTFSGQETLEQAPHGDTVEYSLMRLRSEELEKFKAKMTARLIRQKVFERWKLLGKWYVIAIDGVHVASFSERHCSGCLVKDYDGRKVYQHAKLVASLVTENGFCLPMATEWIENNKEGRYEKQDCEIGAFYRLVEKLRKLYPKLPICLVLDALFLGEPTFEKLKANRMEGILVFKEGAMREVYDWVMKRMAKYWAANVLERRSETEIGLRKPRKHEDKIKRGQPQYETRKICIERTFQWVERIAHWDGRRHFNVLTCLETEDGKKNCDYVWMVTDGIELNRQTVEEVSNHGRMRWKIENEGFNVQKNGGYALEHQYSKDEVSQKCWHELLDASHILMQLVEKGSLVSRLVLGSTLNLAKRLFEHLRYQVFEKPQNPPRIQIRFGLCPNTS